ncbi:UDP-N-acetylglucosamine transporter ROCK1 isoform X2 [Helianthus annuus]|uniref:UDP-N-acetylglucosamine transporter ROCK1 isoform X2 n=1 Tax=Helianthus annuus TaxID=4232 RepID=UPI00165326A3|nr:UDP-N-acetylglucosamine transporter ROCK1 isoform X2 [Helianthus annuus]
MASIKSKAISSNNHSGDNSKVWFYSLLLTIQYGAQPLLTKRCIRQEVIVTSNVLACEIIKVICGLVLMAKDGSLNKALKEWTLIGSLSASGLPAAIYAVQNSLLQISYKNLDSLTFSMLNQTKLIFTALFTYIILRQRQSIQQIGALFILILAAVLLSIGEGSRKDYGSDDPDKVKKHSAYLMTVEMSLVGSLCLLASTYKSPDGEAMRQHGFFHGWTPLTMIPVFINAVGGILVGLVTSYAGGVRKGFVIVSALCVTALLQFVFDGKPPSLFCLLALPLVMVSISIYQKYPYHAKKKET